MYLEMTFLLEYLSTSVFECFSGALYKCVGFSYLNTFIIVENIMIWIAGDPAIMFEDRSL